jgi:uncharacterized protein (TIGR04255 family)
VKTKGKAARRSTKTTRFRLAISSASRAVFDADLGLPRPEGAGCGLPGTALGSEEGKPHRARTELDTREVSPGNPLDFIEPMVIYSKAPIIEAIIDLRVELPEGSSFKKLSELVRVESDRYPISDPVLTTETQITTRPDGTHQTMTDSQIIGYQLRDGKERYGAECTIQGLSVSCRHPYPGWEEFAGEARRLWNTFRTLWRTYRVSRIAVRYINRLDVLPGSGFKDSVKVMPLLPKEFRAPVANYLLRIEFAESVPSRRLIFTQALAPSPVPGRAGLILDFDIFQEDGVPTEENSLWSMFEDLRQRKNEVFEASLTEPMKEMIR